MNGWLVLLGIIPGLLAGLIAFLITYEEYRHHYLDRRAPLRHGLQAAAFAAGVFVLLTILVGWALTHLFS